METLHPRVSLSLLVLGTTILLGWGTQPVWGIQDNSLLPTNINEEALVQILRHVKRGMSAYDQFAIAMLLSREACEKSTTAEQEGATIEDKLLKIWEEDRLDKEPYVYTDNFLVATVKRDEHKGWHAEAVLVGTMETDKKKRKSWVYNFLKVFLDNRKQTYPPDNSCFIFFSLISPCLDYCLNPESDTNILKALQDSLQGYDPRFQAFAFEHVYKEDQPKGQIKLWEAWRQIPMPLFRCSFDQPESCIKCTGDIDTNECLDDIGFLPPDSFFS